MLRLLRVSGFALIDEVEVAFGPGLTVITGETGAGKSILVEALGLLRGGRASAEVIRSGRDEAQVEAIFDVPAGSPTVAALAAAGRTIDAEEGLVVRRVISRTGRGRIHLAGGLATVAELAATVGRLVDITSQHDQQSLMDPESQLAILDAHAGNGALLDEARDAHTALVTAEAALAAFDADVRARAEREDFLRFQVAELAEARLQPGEDEALRAERERVRGAERFVTAASRGEEALYTGEAAAATQVASVARELEGLAPLDPTLAPLGERLRSAHAEIEDVARALGRYGQGIRVDPGRLEEIEERLYLIGRLLRKHGGNVAAALERQGALEAELAELGSFEDSLAAKQAEVEAARGRLAGIATRLTERRRKAARGLGRRVDETLAELGFASARLEIALEDRGGVGPRGGDRVRFLFKPNPGEEARPLQRVASGGELSRVMLAVKRALASADEALLYVFDEIDAGIGGATAEVIGRKLRAIAEERQVLAVTHLPQIAAAADRHVRVSKEATRARTTVHVEVLGEAARAGELARMLGGARPSSEAEAHAAEMLRRARSASVN